MKFLKESAFIAAVCLVLFAGLTFWADRNDARRMKAAASELATSDEAATNETDQGPSRRLLITNFQIIPTSGTTARVMWSTNRPSVTLLDYGKTASFEIGTVYQSDNTVVHDVTLSRLEAGATYVLRARALDGGGAGVIMPPSSFTANPPTDVIPPVMSGIRVERVTATSVFVRWFTDENAQGSVEFGKSLPYSRGEFVNTFTSDHIVLLDELDPTLPIHYRIRSVDVLGNAIVTADALLTVPGK